MVLKMGSARITTDIRSYFTSWRNVKKTGAYRLYYREWQVRFMKECFQCVEYFVLFLVCRSGVGGTSQVIVAYASRVYILFSLEYWGMPLSSYMRFVSIK